jgi:oligopeptide transport system substrate-binding protein
MRTCFYMDPLTVDPRKNGDLYSSAFLFMLYDGLTHLLPTGKVELSLAKSVDISPDGKVYVFTLRQAFWSDGHSITAHDFEYSWKKTLDPQFCSTCPQLFFPIKNAELALTGKIDLDEVAIHALDEETLRVELTHPTPYFLSLVSSCNFFPIPKHIAETKPDWDQIPAQKLTISGPFQLIRWEKRKEIILAKNPFYWNAKNTTLSELKISIVSNEYTTLDMFENDELDLVSFALSSIPLNALKTYHRTGQLQLLPMGSTAFCAFNLHQFPFTNQNIRKAFSYAVDREKLVTEITQLNEIPATRCIPPILDQNINYQIIPPYSEALAKSHLHKGMAELGIPFDVSNLQFRLFLDHLTLTYDETQTSRNVAQALQEQWSRVLGFKVKLQFQKYHMQMENILNGTYAITLSTWLAQYTEPMNILERFKYKKLKKNFPRFENEEYIQLLNQSFQEDQEKRQAILLKAEKLLMEQMPIAPLFHFNFAIIKKPAVSGVEISPTGVVQFKHAKMKQAEIQTIQTAAV